MGTATSQRRRIIPLLFFSLLIVLWIASNPAKAASTLPFNLVQNEPVVNACVQKVCGQFLVDFGANGSPALYLRKNLIAHLTGVKTLNKTIERVNSKGTPQQLELLKVNGLVLAGKLFDNVTMAAWEPWGTSLGTEQSDKSRMTAIDGVIGLNVFEKFGIIELDYPRHRFVLGLSKKTWPSNASHFRLGNAGISIPVTTDGHKYWFFLDTGSSQSLVKLALIPNDAHLQPCETHGKMIKNCKRYLPQAFEISNFTIPHTALLAINYKEPPYDGILGGDVLHHIRLRLNFLDDTFSVLKPISN